MLVLALTTKAAEDYVLFSRDIRIICSDLLLACPCFLQRNPKTTDDLVYVASRLLDNGNSHVSEMKNVSKMLQGRERWPSPDAEVVVLDILVQPSRNNDTFL